MRPLAAGVNIALRKPGSSELVYVAAGEIPPEWAADELADAEHLFVSEQEAAGPPDDGDAGGEGLVNELIGLLEQLGADPAEVAEVLADNDPALMHAHLAEVLTELAALNDDQRAALALLVDEDDAGETPAPAAPPRSGRGSGRDAWADYAAELGVDVPEDADRDDIIAAVDAHTS